MLPDVVGLDGWLLTGSGLGDDHDGAAFDPGDPLALVADRLDGHLTDPALLDRRRWRLTVPVERCIVDALA